MRTVQHLFFLHFGLSGRSLQAVRSCVNIFTPWPALAVALVYYYYYYWVGVEALTCCVWLARTTLSISAAASSHSQPQTGSAMLWRHAFKACALSLACSQSAPPLSICACAVAQPLRNWSSCLPCSAAAHAPPAALTLSPPKGDSGAAAERMDYRGYRRRECARMLALHVPQ